MSVPRLRLTPAWWGADEWRAAARCIFTGHVRRGSESTRLVDEIATLAGRRPVFALNAGRNAITASLNAFKQRSPDRDVVLMPEYVCPAVPEAVARAGLRGRLVAVGDDLNIDPRGLQDVLDDTVLAVIAVHMYGLPAAIDSIEVQCRQSGAFLIDDAAHGLGISHAGRPLGSFGDVGILSFAQAKVVSTGVRGSGGALIVSNENLTELLTDELRDLDPARRRVDGFLHFVLAYQAGAAGARSSETLEWGLQKYLPKFAQQRIAARYEPALISNLDACIALAQLSRLRETLEERQVVLDRYAHLLPDYPALSFPQAQSGRFLSRLMCLLPEPHLATRIRTALATRGIECRLPYPRPALPHAASARHEAMTRRLLELPISRGMTDDDIRRVLDCIQQLASTNTPHNE